MENIVLNALLVVAALTFTIAAIAAAFGFTAVQPAYAPPPAPCANCGASELAPGEEPQRPGWDPNGAPEDAPGHCIGCAKEFAPGQEGLEAGIIGPELKK